MEIASVALATVEIAAAKLSGVKMASLLSFISGAAVMLGFSNLVGSKQSQHVYELRMYHVNEGKMDALVARFGDHTDAIFKRHNMKSIGYWVPEDTRYSQNLFVYILEHPSSEEARKNWAAFQADPEWQKVKADSEINGALASHIDRYLMDPTSFSGLKQITESRPNVMRLLIGKPLTMRRMAKHVHDAASYAPVTILADERPDGIHLFYDRMTSLLAPYENSEAVEVAKALDRKVESVLITAPQ